MLKGIAFGTGLSGQRIKRRFKCSVSFENLVDRERLQVDVGYVRISTKEQNTARQDTEVYVSSNYISTTKPVQQQSTPSSSSTSSSSNQSTTSNQSSTSTPSTPSSQGTSSQTPSQSSTSSDGSGLAPEVQAAKEEELRRRIEELGDPTVDRGSLTPEQIAEIGAQLNQGN